MRPLLGQTITATIAIYDGSDLADADTDTLELHVYDDEGTDLDVEGEGLVSWTSTETGRYQVALELSAEFFERGRSYSAEAICEVSTTALATPAGGIATFIVDDTVERLEYRHGEGMWGPTHDREDKLGNASPPKAYAIPIGDWSTALFLFTDEAAPDETVFGGVGGMTPTDAFFTSGVLGPADNAITFDGGIAGGAKLEGDSNTVADFDTGDLGLYAVAAGIEDPGAGIRIGKTNSTAGYFVAINSGILTWELRDGATYTGVTPLTATVDVSSVLHEIDRGYVMIAALARTENLIRVGIMTRDGTLLMSASVDASSLGNMTNTALFQLSDNSGGYTIVSALGFGQDMTGVPAGLESCLRALHLRMFGGLSDADVDQVQDGLATSSALSTVDGKVDAVDGVVDAIFVDTAAMDSRLPTDPADASDIAASFSTVNTKLDAIDDFLDTEVAAILAAVDTEVAAIKAKTDNLPTDPADQSLLEGHFDDVDAAIAALDFSAVSAQLTTIEGKIDVIDANVDAMPDDVLAAFRAWEHDDGVTWDGLMIRMESWLSGERVVTGAGASQHQSYKRRDGSTAYEGDIDATTGSRAEADVSGSE